VPSPIFDPLSIATSSRECARANALAVPSSDEGPDPLIRRPPEICVSTRSRSSVHSGDCVSLTADSSLDAAADTRTILDAYVFIRSALSRFRRRGLSAPGRDCGCARLSVPSTGAGAERDRDSEQATRLRERAGTLSRFTPRGAPHCAVVVGVDDLQSGARFGRCLAMVVLTIVVRNGLAQPRGSAVRSNVSQRRHVSCEGRRVPSPVAQAGLTGPGPGAGRRSGVRRTAARRPSARRFARSGSTTSSASSAIHRSVTNSKCLPRRSPAETRRPRLRRRRALNASSDIDASIRTARPATRSTGRWDDPPRNLIVL
jgi:hypothetical protein